MHYYWCSTSIEKVQFLYAFAYNFDWNFGLALLKHLYLNQFEFTLNRKPTYFHRFKKIQISAASLWKTAVQYGFTIQYEMKAIAQKTTLSFRSTSATSSKHTIWRRPLNQRGRSHQTTCYVSKRLVIYSFLKQFQNVWKAQRKCTVQVLLAPIYYFNYSFCLSGSIWSFFTKMILQMTKASSAQR